MHRAKGEVAREWFFALVWERDRLLVPMVGVEGALFDNRIICSCADPISKRNMPLLPFPPCLPLSTIFASLFAPNPTLGSLNSVDVDSTQIDAPFLI